ncbi:MAG: type VII toxin-antitoxin system HepT family RNase toxin [Solirubrobacterales bacterium]
MVDPDRVRQLLDALSDYRTSLAELAELPAERYGGRDAIAGRYLVQVSAQTCIDLANHVISSSGWRVPRDYADAFTVLEENAVLDAGLAERLRALARLRNLLVHAYGDVDDSLVHTSLHEDLDDLDAFARAIGRLVAKGE